MYEQSKALADLYRHLGPEMVLAAFACLIFLGGAFKACRRTWGTAAIVGLGVAFAVHCVSPLSPVSPLLGDSVAAKVPVVFDSFAFFVRGLALASGVVLVLLSWDAVPEANASDYHACLLLLVGGLGLIGSANDLVTLFLALELVSIPTYILLYIPKHDDASKEAALKYFLLSIFSSALLLFGFSYLYGLTGSTNIAVLLQTLHEARDASRAIPVVSSIALITIVCGLGFRITAAPFHFYAPDVYQGTSTIGAALLSYVPKIAGFAALLRVFGFVLPPGVVSSGAPLGAALSSQIPILFWLLAALTMFTGNLLALLQDNVRRLLAYSSIAHAGYMLMALASAPYLRQQADGPDGVASLLFYLVAYGAMTIGLFAVFAQVSSNDHPIETVDDLAGLGKSHPLLALLAALFLFSLVGIPLTAGFTGKFLVFFGAMAVPEGHAAPYRWLALLGVVNAAIGGWYYLRMVAAMYLRNPLRPAAETCRVPGWATIAICAVLTLGLSFPPGSTLLMAWTDDAARNVAQPTLRIADGGAPNLLAAEKR